MFHLCVVFLHAHAAVGVPRLCMFDACAALYREVHLLFAWMVSSDGFTACTDSVRRACIGVCLLVQPHIFFAFSEAQGYCFCAFSSG